MKVNKHPGILTPFGILSLVLLLALLAGAISCGSNAPSTTSSTPAATTTAEKPITLTFSTFNPPVAFAVTDFLLPWFADIEKRSNGRMKIEAHLGGELLSMADTYNGVIQGTVDIGQVFPSMVGGKFSMSEIVNFWSYDKNVAQRSKMFQDLMKSVPEYPQEYDEVKLLWFGNSFTAGLATAKKPVRQIEDIKGMKFTTTGPWCAARQKALGIVPVSIAPEALVTSLQTGVIEGMAVPLWGLRDMGWGSVLKYVMPMSIYDGADSLVMNKNTWNKLPPDIQKIFTDTAVEWGDKWDQLQIKVAKERIASAPKEFGIEFIDIPQSELARWSAADKDVINQYATELESKGKPGKKFAAEFLRLEAQYSQAIGIFK